MASKEEIRSSHRAARSALPLAAQDAAAAGIARHGLQWASGLAGGRQGTFAAYLGVGAEPPTLPLLTALADAGHRVLLPVCEPDIELSWVYWTRSPDLSAAGTPPSRSLSESATAPRSCGTPPQSSSRPPPWISRATASDKAAATTTNSLPPWPPCLPASGGASASSCRVADCRRRL